jgi:hypothetical protein
MLHRYSVIAVGNVNRSPEIKDIFARARAEPNDDRCDDCKSGYACQSRFVGLEREQSDRHDSPDHKDLPCFHRRDSDLFEAESAIAQ